MTFERLPAQRSYIPTRWQARNAPSVLDLLRRLLDADLDRERLAGATVTRPARGRRAQFIEPDGDPHMGVGGAKSVDAPARHVLAIVVARAQASGSRWWRASR